MLIMDTTAELHWVDLRWFVTCHGGCTEYHSLVFVLSLHSSLHHLPCCFVVQVFEKFTRPEDTEVKSEIYIYISEYITSLVWSRQ